jgi:serine/threonine-protein kinase
VVSRGPAPVTLPNYVGKPAVATIAALQKAGLKVTSTPAYDKKVPSGSVVSMSPKAGQTVPKGSTVAIVVSKGPPPVAVPDVFRVPESDARKQLTALGFVVRVSYPIGFTPFGRVVTQSAKAGTQLPFGSTVTIEVV